MANYTVETQQMFTEGMGKAKLYSGIQTSFHVILFTQRHNILTKLTVAFKRHLVQKSWEAKSGLNLLSSLQETLGKLLTCFPAEFSYS